MDVEITCLAATRKRSADGMSRDRVTFRPRTPLIPGFTAAHSNRVTGNSHGKNYFVSSSTCTRTAINCATMPPAQWLVRCASSIFERLGLKEGMMPTGQGA
jgi:hypothetical protein